MARPFDAFVIFAEMRTGSNHLEALLSGVPGIAVFGEVYNPVFIGSQKQTELLGYDLARREADPGGLFEAILAAGPELPGLRFFHDHDPRMVARFLDDRRVAKVILRRNPLDSYVSRRIATETGQWKLTDARHRKAAQVRFEAAEFQDMLAAWDGFQARIRHALQLSGQTAFEIGYDDLGDADVLNGLLRFLRVEGAIDPGASTLKRQNPGTPAEKVTNPEEMAAALARLDPFGAAREGMPEPDRPPAVRSFAVLPDTGLMVLPVPGGPVAEMLDWMAALDGLPRDGVRQGLTQRELRQWMRRFPGHRKVAMLRHPLARAHHVFCHEILAADVGNAELRRMLAERHGVPLPPERGDAAAHRAAFLAWLGVVKASLAGQTGLIPPASWAGQHAVLQGMAAFALPDLILREEAAEAPLADLARALGRAPVALTAPQPEGPVALSEIRDAEVEAAVRDVYRRDYVFFGFEDWTGA